MILKVGPDAASPVQIKSMFVTEAGRLCPERCWMCDQIFFQLETCFPRATPPKRVKNSKRETAGGAAATLPHLIYGTALLVNGKESSYRRPNSKGALDVFK